MVVKRGPPTTVSLKFHVSISLRAEWSPTGQWSEANLNSASEISSGSGHSPPVPCSGIEPLHAVLGDDSVAVQSLFVRCAPASSSISPPQQRPTSTATASAAAAATEGRGTTAPPTGPPAAPADLWVELKVSNVRANSQISTSPALLSAWRLLLPSLVTYTRAEARSPASAAADQDRQGKTSDDGDSGRNGGHKDGLEVRALEAVYASLKPAADARLRLDSACCVGPAPGASGLNAVPAAVVMKGNIRQYDTCFSELPAVWS